MKPAETIRINLAAKEKGCSRQAIHAAIKAGKLQAVKIPTVVYEVTRESLEKWHPNPKMQVRAGTV